MKYINANLVLPSNLVEELQNYIQGGYLYIPTKQTDKKQWGELTGYRQYLKERNSNICLEYHNGVEMSTLAKKYHLSIYAIRKIIYSR